MTPWSITWTPTNMVKWIFDGLDGSEYEYDGSNSRIREIRKVAGQEVEKKIFCPGSEQFFEKNTAGAWKAKTIRVHIGAMAGAAAGFAGGFLGSALGGGNLGASLSAGLTGATWGAVSGAAAGAIGGYFGHDTGTFWTEVKRAAAHGISSGLIDDVRGGKFAAGFASGFISSAATHGLGIDDWDIHAGTVAAAVIGGTASVVGGGKFENGAMYGAFQYLFNAKMEELAEAANKRGLREAIVYNGKSEDAPKFKALAEATAANSTNSVVIDAASYKEAVLKLEIKVGSGGLFDRVIFLDHGGTSGWGSFDHGICDLALNTDLCSMLSNCLTTNGTVWMFECRVAQTGLMCDLARNLNHNVVAPLNEVYWVAFSNTDGTYDGTDLFSNFMGLNGKRTIWNTYKP